MYATARKGLLLPHRTTVADLTHARMHACTHTHTHARDSRMSEIYDNFLFRIRRARKLLELSPENNPPELLSTLLLAV